MAQLSLSLTALTTRVILDPDSNPTTPVSPISPSLAQYLERVPLVEGQLVTLCGLKAVQGHGLHPTVPGLQPRTQQTLPASRG